VIAPCPPCCWIECIQRIYLNSFRSVWEYEEAIKSKKVDWRSEIGELCPVCGEVCGYREIGSYQREARELWPVREGIVPVARFQCRGTPGSLPTFSMLPYQMLPYHRYTLRSMVMAVLLWREYWKDPEERGTAYQAEQALPGEGRVSAWQLSLWVLSIQSAFERGHSELAGRYDFSSVRYFDDLPFVLDEVFGYFEAVCRGPPGRGEGVISFVREYAKRTGRFFLGVPSQSR
jgi:hypothetical protein